MGLRDLSKRLVLQEMLAACSLSKVDVEGLQLLNDGDPAPASLADKLDFV